MSHPSIPYGWHHLDDADIAAVVEVLRHGLLTQGDVVARFEQAVAAYCGARHAVACNSATSALLLAYRALGLTTGNELWTAAIGFVATASSALHCGATVDFVDVDAASAHLDVVALEARLDAAARAGQVPRVLVPMHYGGRSCDMAAIAALARTHGVRIVEDAAHALGARHADGTLVGNCRYSDIVVFSFHPVKSITAGEGGMALTDDTILAERMARLRSHDIDRGETAARGAWHYEIREPGYNFRLTDIQAALGLSQLRRLDAFVARRRQLAARYRQGLAHLPLHLPPADNAAASAWHLYPVRLHDSRRRRALFDYLRSVGIGTQVHYIPLYRLGLFRASHPAPDRYPGAERFYAGVLSLPLFPSLTEAEQTRVIAEVARGLA